MAITLGSSQTINSNTSVSNPSTRIVRMTDSKVLVAYYNYSSNNRITLKIGDVGDDGNISFNGSDYNLTTGELNCYDICKVDDSKFLLVYVPTSGTAYAYTFTFSGSEISADVTSNVSSLNSCKSFSIDRISSTQFIVSYARYSNWYGDASVLTYNGSSISAGTVYNFYAGTIYSSVVGSTGERTIRGTIIKVLSSSLAVVIYQKGSGDYYAHYRLINISGSDLSAGNTGAIGETNIRLSDVVVLSSTKIVIAYRFYLIVADLVSDNLSLGSQYQVQGTQYYDITACKINENKLCVSYNTGNQSLGAPVVVKMISVSGTSFTEGSSSQAFTVSYSSFNELDCTKNDYFYLISHDAPYNAGIKAIGGYELTAPAFIPKIIFI